MSATIKPMASPIRLPRLRWPILSFASRNQRQATVDLISTSPYLRRDIGLLEEHFSRRKP